MGDTTGHTVIPPVLRPRGQMDRDKISQTGLSEIRLAYDYTIEKKETRQTHWDRYYGKKLGNEQAGRSQYQSRDLLDTIEWMMPYFVRTFASGDPKVILKVLGQPAWVGKALLKQIIEDLSHASPNFFVIFYQWVKDGLVTDTGVLKIYWKREHKLIRVEFEAPLSQAQMQQIVDDPEIKITKMGGPTVDPATGDMAYEGVEISMRQLKRNNICVENVPHWEFMVGRESRHVNDRHPKGHVTTLLLDDLRKIDRTYSEAQGGKPYFDKGVLDELENAAGEADGIADGETAEEDSHQELTQGEDVSHLYGKTDTGAKTKVRYIEWHTSMDVNNDGFLEDVVLMYGNKKLLRWEPEDEDYEEGDMPFSAWSPIIDPFKFYGLAVSELIEDIQNVQTMITRRILDLFDFQTSGRWLVDPQGSVNIQQLRNYAPGTVVFGRKDTVTDLSPKEFNPSMVNILTHFDGVKENRTGISRTNQGMVTDTVNSTATGIVQAQSAGLQRLELVGRVFAEVGAKDFYYKAARLYQQYMDQPIEQTLGGVQRVITPDMIKGKKIIVEVNMGIEANVGFQEAANIERMVKLLFEINGTFPGLLTPEKIHSISSRYITALGFRDVDSFVNEMQKYVEEYMQTVQHQQEVQERMVEVEEKLKAFEAAIKGQALEQKGAIEKAKLAKERWSDLLFVAQKERDSQRDSELGILNLIHRGEPGPHPGLEYAS